MNLQRAKKDPHHLPPLKASTAPTLSGVSAEPPKRSLRLQNLFSRYPRLATENLKTTKTDDTVICKIPVLQSPTDDLLRAKVMGFTPLPPRPEIVTALKCGKEARKLSKEKPTPAPLCPSKLTPLHHSPALCGPKEEGAASTAPATVAKKATGSPCLVTAPGAAPLSLERPVAQNGCATNGLQEDIIKGRIIDDAPIELPPSAFEEGFVGSVRVCPVCNRNFSDERFERHFKICNQVNENAKTRGTFCSNKQRQLAVGGQVMEQLPEGYQRRKPKRVHKPNTAVLSQEQTESTAQDKEKEWLRQRAAEIAFTLRMSLTSERELELASKTVEELFAFLQNLDAICQRLGITPEICFQELLSRLVGSSQMDFDGQHGTGAVPMHQAKVLDRKARLVDAKVSAALQNDVGQERLKEMVSSVGRMRAAVKIKVEDANDLKMARASLLDAHNFFRVLRTHADRLRQTVYETYIQLTVQ